jgi:hypothetical protein
MQIGRFTPYEQLATSALTPAREPVQLLNAAQRGPAGAAEDGAIVDTIPPAPTDEARALVDQAAERVEQLLASNRQLHFRHDEEANRVVIEVRDLDGNVLKTIPPSKALDVMLGAEL